MPEGRLARTRQAYAAGTPATSAVVYGLNPLNFSFWRENAPQSEQDMNKVRLSMRHMEDMDRAMRKALADFEQRSLDA